MVSGTEDDSGLLSSMGIPESMWEQMREKSVVQIFPENWVAFEAFNHLRTQWRFGMNGREGLIYSEAYLWMNEESITNPEDRKDLMWAIRIMEHEVIDVLSTRK